MHLNFKHSNNEAKCKALLAGLRAAKYVGVVMVIVHSDCHLVARQLEGKYEVINNWLCRYIKAYERMKIEFQEMILQKVPREENKKVNELARMTGALTNLVEEDMVVRVELIA